LDETIERLGSTALGSYRVKTAIKFAVNNARHFDDYLRKEVAVDMIEDKFVRNFYKFDNINKYSEWIKAYEKKYLQHVEKKPAQLDIFYS
jgi:hypothetical protein